MPEPITGMNGNVSLDAEIADVRSFTLNILADNKVYATSDTAGWKKSAEGIKSWNAQINVYLPDATFPAWTVGAVLAATLTSAAGKTMSGSCRLDSLENIDVNIEESGMVGCTLNVTGNGAIT